MLNEIKYELFLFAVSGVFGVACALLFDSFRASRVIVKTSVAVTAVEDIVFWILTTLCFFILSLKFNNGQIRLFMLLGVVFGALLYFNTISRYVLGFTVWLSRLIIMFVKLVTRWVNIVLRVLLFPIRMLLRLLGKPAFIVVSIGRRGIKKMCKNVKYKAKIFKKFSPFAVCFKKKHTKTP